MLYHATISYTDVLGKDFDFNAQIEAESQRQAKSELLDAYTLELGTTDFTIHIH